MPSSKWPTQIGLNSLFENFLSLVLSENFFLTYIHYLVLCFYGFSLCVCNCVSLSTYISCAFLLLSVLSYYDLFVLFYFLFHNYSLDVGLFSNENQRQFGSG